MAGSDDSTPDARALLTPLVARVIELGRGPPALVRWVAIRLGRGGSARELAARLAREFPRRSHHTTDTLGAVPRAGAADTTTGPGR